MENVNNVENQNVVANPVNAAQAAPKDEAPISLLEIAQMGQGGFKLQCELFGKILTSKSLSSLAETIRERLAELPTYEANLRKLEKEVHQKQATERAEEIKSILADLTPEQLKEYLPAM